MSSMRNAVQRRNHKERAQPEGRSKWGLLEKNKDYKLRAKDHKTKQKRLKILKEKAALANPDEFSFKMMSNRTKDGIRVGDRGNKALNHEVVQLLKTQDIGYVRTMLQRTRKERERLEQEVQLANGGRFVALKAGKDGDEDAEDAWLKEGDDQVEAQKITFVDSKDAQRQMLEESDDEGMDLANSPPKKLSKRQAEEQRLAEIAAGRARKKRAQQQESRRELLIAMRKRENDLLVAEQELDLQRAKMNNSVGGVNKDGLKFKIRERKR